MIQVTFPLIACFTITNLLSQFLKYFQYFDFLIAVEVTRGRIWNPSQVRGVNLNIQCRIRLLACIVFLSMSV